MIRAVLFDLDETLIFDEPVTQQAIRQTAELAAQRAGVDPQRLARSFPAIYHRLWEASPHFPYCHRIGHSASEGLWARYEVALSPQLEALRRWAPEYRRQAWREALAQQGVDDPELAEHLAQAFMQCRRRFPRYPEVDEVLTHLRGRYRLGIVTNGVPDLQREKIAGSGLAAHFHASVVSGEIDCGKPDPGILFHICTQLEVNPGECVLVGDNPQRDVAAALAAGMRAVWVRRPWCRHGCPLPAHLTCDNLRELLPWLQRA